MMSQHFRYNDAVLLVSLLYFCSDLLSEWDSFNRCSKPIHLWMFASFACIISFRLAQLLTPCAASMAAAATGSVTHSPSNILEFMMDLRQKGAMSQALLKLTWFMAVPFALWIFLGTSWLWAVSHETRECAPEEYFWFLGLFLLVCYCWMLFFATLGVKALVLERRVQRAEGSLREIENEDVLRRWGPVSRISSHRALEHGAPATGCGLSPAAIRALPRPRLASAACECSICLAEMEVGDSVRSLPACGHTFHCSCIDLWLLRRADCPLCKQSVIACAGRDSELV